MIPVINAVLQEQNGIVEYYTGQGQATFRSRTVGEREAEERYNWFMQRNLVEIVITQVCPGSITCEIGGSTHHGLCTPASNLDIIVYGLWSDHEIYRLNSHGKKDFPLRLRNYISPLPYEIEFHFDHHEKFLENPARHIDWQITNKNLYIHRQVFFK